MDEILRCRGQYGAIALALAGLVVLCGCTDQTTVHEGEMTQLLAVLPGHYDNTAQVEADIRAHAHPADAVALTITHVYTPRLGHHVYYAQETAADDPRRVYSQKMYSFTVEDKRGIVETLYELTEPVRWRDGQQNKDVLYRVGSGGRAAGGLSVALEEDGHGLRGNPRSQSLSRRRPRRDRAPGRVRGRCADDWRLQIPAGARIASTSRFSLAVPGELAASEPRESSKSADIEAASGGNAHE